MIEYTNDIIDPEDDEELFASIWLALAGEELVSDTSEDDIAGEAGDRI